MTEIERMGDCEEERLGHQSEEEEEELLQDQNHKEEEEEEKQKAKSPSLPSSPSSSADGGVVVVGGGGGGGEEALDGKLGKLGLEVEVEEESVGGGGGDGDGDGEVREMENGEGKSVDSVDSGRRRFQYPVRGGEPDCPYYLRTGTCRYASNCKFNHPPRRRFHQVRSLPESSESVYQGFKEKENGEYPERSGQLECKYYLKTGGCKFGKACRYNHPQEKTLVVQASEFNFLGLPIRPGEKECPFYMRMGSCKFGVNCRFHHPDPTAAGLSNPVSGYSNGGPAPLHTAGVSQPTMPSWSLPRSSNDAIPYLDASPPYMPVMLPPPQGTHLNMEWNGYQTPVSPLYPSDGKVHTPLAPLAKDSTKNGDGPSHHHQQSPVDEFPERPGQKECQYYMKNGDCKYKSACRFHHPKNRIQKSPVLSPMGLPLRPDQIVCVHYSRYGICKFGPACKYDHPPNSAPADRPIVSGSGHPQSLGTNATLGGPEMTDASNTRQQPMSHPTNSAPSDCPVVSC
ncbi:hypothetical protein Scep_018032 [Stephania cephalantha]|uniref:C3H1-type domain-containing protein n=1 Tax=Stephania cephalantha TaxID=152367 RepID=A0AAP0IQK3_9MAGN